MEGCLANLEVARYVSQAHYGIGVSSSFFFQLASDVTIVPPLVSPVQAVEAKAHLMFMSSFPVLLILNSAQKAFMQPSCLLRRMSLAEFTEFGQIQGPAALNLHGNPMYRFNLL